MKQLFDPHMFNYTWESLDHDQYVVATYYIEDVVEDSDFIDHFGQVQRLALEGSTATWVEVSEETPELRERLTSKVLGYFEVPAPKGSKKAVIQLGFPIGAWDVNVNVPMMLLSISGNCFAFPTHMRLLDLYIPKKVADEFQGPKFGIKGIREMLGVHDRPLVLQIIKPKMGMTPAETANQVYQSALGGADLVKDDEMCSELSNCPFDARLEAVLKALERAEKETGQKTLYMVSITDEVDRINEKARRAVRNGATGLLLAYSAGPSALRVLAEDPQCQAPILLHVSHMLALLPRISFPVLSKICRLCGADMMLSPSIWSSIPVVSPEECYRNAQVMLAPFYHIKQTWPMPAAGMYPGLVPVLLEEYGTDIIIPAGGGMLGHPMGYTAGARAWRQAIDAAMAGIPLPEAAKEKAELRVALETWGLRRRPVTRWGYFGKEFHPAFAAKNI
ncbi:MAG: RuBisCO large subunit C-terminal-like domain-containing protein [Anaerolineae bacterium]|nr:RuBisCO large subunit C-terminal-like domain-containing protein [Anaerolineae bacterium]